MNDTGERWLIVIFTATIGLRRIPVSEAEARAALPPGAQVVGTVRRDLSEQDWDGQDLTAAVPALDALVARIADAEDQLHPTKIGVFATGPISLLAGLGRRLGDAARFEIFQLHREPFAGWAWRPDGSVETPIDFPPVRPHAEGFKDVVVVLSLSHEVKESEWRGDLPGLSPAVYEIRAAEISLNLMVTRRQQRAFAIAYREWMGRIKAAHGAGVRLHLFAGVPLSVAVELGRQLLQRAFASVKVYDWLGAGYGRCLELAPAPPSDAGADRLGPYVSIPGSGTVGRTPPRGRGWDSPQHAVHGEAFEIGANTVTWGSWREICAAAPEERLHGAPPGVDPALPVTGVSWLDALRFANLCSRLDGRTPAFQIGDGGASVQLIPGDGYRLPLEHEWELAALAGTPGDRGPSRDTGGAAAPARAMRASAHGLYQMLGNVWEWCLDPWDPEVYRALAGPVSLDGRAANLRGADGVPRLDLRLADQTAARVVRGGGWDVESGLVDAHTRCFAPPVGNPAVGFRLVRPVRAPRPTPPPSAPVSASSASAASPSASPPNVTGVAHMSTFNIQAGNVQVVQHGTGHQDNRVTGSAALPQRLEDLLALVASGPPERRELDARLAAIEGELSRFAGGVSDLQAMIEPLWQKHFTEERRGTFERVLRALPDRAIWLGFSQVLSRLLAG